MLFVLDVQTGEPSLFYQPEPDEYKIWIIKDVKTKRIRFESWGQFLAYYR